MPPKIKAMQSFGLQQNNDYMYDANIILSQRNHPFRSSLLELMHAI